MIVTEDGVRPLVRPEQTTLILRDISNDTTVETIRDIFQQLSLLSNLIVGPPVVNIRPDMNDTWYVSYLFN